MKNQTAIYECLAFDDAWAGALKNWFIKRLPPCSGLPQAVILPSDSAIQFLKKQLLKEDIPLFGIHFYTPGTLRQYLSKIYHCLEIVELRENLHLLMKVAARALEGNPVAQAAAIEAEQFVRLADLLETTGWSTRVLKNQYVRELVEKYQEAQEQYGVMTVQKMTNCLYELSKNPEMAFSNVLIFGFYSKHWPNYKMLLSAARSSKEATICFLTQDNTRLIDQAWLGSWEQEFGSSERLSGQLEPKAFSYLSYYFDEMNNGADLLPRNHLPEIYIVEDILREAEVIVARVAQALALEEPSQIGIVFPNQTSPLAREVARLLEYEEIAHYNHLGFVGGSSRRQQLFESWVAWQRSPRLGDFLSFLDELTNEGILSINKFQDFEKATGQALQTLLTDDLQLIFTYFKVNKCSTQVAELLKQWTLLPPEATFQEYIALAQAALEVIEWPEDLTLIEQRAGVLLQDLEKPIKKDDFLLWLTSVTKALGRITKYWGQHQYAFVHLITEEEALTQSWSHLILAGVNQAEWPSAKPEVIFLGDKQISELNNDSLVEGNQGEGHLAVKNGLSLLPSSIDQYSFSKANFAILVGTPSKKLILTAHKKDPQKSKDAAMSEFLEKVYWVSEGALLDAEAINIIIRDTQLWVSQYNQQKKHVDASIQDIIHAYHQRRNVREAFDEYSFSFIESNKPALNVSCKAWEEILTSPERAWFKHILGTDKNAVLLGQPLYALAKGTWVHSWINLEGEGVRPKAWSISIKEKANKVYHSVEQTFSALNRNLPDIWKAYWHTSKRITLSLSETLNESLSDRYLFSEYSINHNEQIQDTSLVDIILKGRIDLLAYPLNEWESKNHELWILDFKTGASGALTEDKIKHGIGVQLVLYALKFYLDGFKNIKFSIVQPGVSSIKQIDLMSVLENSSIFDAINFIYNSGKLGVRASMDGSYGHSAHFPLATIKVADDILAKKWKLTHANLSF